MDESRVEVGMNKIRGQNQMNSSSDSISEFQHVLSIANQAADEASQILLHYFGRLSEVTEKFQAGLVSEADRESEKKIQSIIRNAFADHSFLGEETGLTSGKSSEHCWIVDPLDGTTNYVHRFPFFCISIAYELRGRVEVAVVDAPKLGLRYQAVRGHGAYLNGQKISVSSRKTLTESLCGTGFAGQPANLPRQLFLIEHIVRHARGIRRAGAAALDLCFLAEGIYDVFWEDGLAPWDTAAGALIAQEAGGIVTDWAGTDFLPTLKSVVAASPLVHSEFLALGHSFDQTRS